MAEYLILIYGEEAAFAEPGPETMNQMMKGHQVFGERNAAALRGGNALQPTATATSVRPDASGGFVVTDGPFGETKEALGGYYLVEANPESPSAEGMAISRGPLCPPSTPAANR